MVAWLEGCYSLWQNVGIPYNKMYGKPRTESKGRIEPYDADACRNVSEQTAKNGFQSVFVITFNYTLHQRKFRFEPVMAGWCTVVIYG